MNSDLKLGGMQMGAISMEVRAVIVSIELALAVTRA